MTLFASGSHWRSERTLRRASLWFGLEPAAVIPGSDGSSRRLSSVTSAGAATHSSTPHDYYFVKAVGEFGLWSVCRR